MSAPRTKKKAATSRKAPSVKASVKVTKSNAPAKARAKAAPVASKGRTKASGKTAANKRGARGKRVDAPVLDRLVQEAKAVRENAYAPYSSYYVGAAIATKSGKIYVGCNVENASFGASLCAERNAVAQMVAAGDPYPVAAAVVTGDEGASPCGICRQVLSEFTSDMPIALVGLGAEGGEVGRVVQLADLLPLQFRLER